MRRVLIVVALVALAVPAQAFAHASLERTSPGFEQRLQTSPQSVILRFDQYVEHVPYAMRLYSANGELPLQRIRVKGRELVADVHVVPRLDRVVEPEIEGIQTLAGVELDVRVGLDGLDVVGARVVDAVDRACLELEPALGGLIAPTELDVRRQRGGVFPL